MDNYDVTIFNQIPNKNAKITLMLEYLIELAGFVEKLKNSYYEYMNERTYIAYKEQFSKLQTLKNMIKEEISI